MNKYTYLLKKLSLLTSIGIFCIDGQAVMEFQKHSEYNPISQSAELRKLLKDGADSQEMPYIYRDSFMVYFVCLKATERYYMIGPMSLELFDRVTLHQYYKQYDIQESVEKQLKHFTLTEVLDVVEVVANIVLQKEYSDDDLLYANKIVTDTKEQEKREQVIFDMGEGEEELYHHTYQEERRLLDSIREGRVEDALQYSRNMDAEIGKLSIKEMNHWKNVAIVAITLCTRAAIDGGISPSIAYRISDFYIQKCDDCTDIAHIIKNRNHAVEELTEQVKRKQGKRTSSYIEQCKDYVVKHYREKIYLSDIAETLGLSETYLSRLFRKETGMRFQDYLVSIRLERAKNLLKYSEEPLSNIAAYVNFPSQSYMGRLFKEKYQISPKKFREQHAPSEYFSKDGKDS